MKFFIEYQIHPIFPLHVFEVESEDSVEAEEKFRQIHPKHRITHLWQEESEGIFYTGPIVPADESL